MRAVAAPDSGLRAEHRLTHAYFVDVPGFPRPFLLSDAVLNIAPNLAAKREIVQNAIDFALDLGIATPQVAVLAAVEGVTAALPATGDAAALAKMAEQGLISGGVVEGPMTVDTALSAAAARSNGIESKMAGLADVLIVPNLESGSMMLRTMTGIFGALAAGVALAARVPIVLAGRSDSIEVRMASCVLASLVAQSSRSEARPSEPAGAERGIKVAA
jgi:phosphate acetyltransferase/phosphate butyryltransferase